MRVSAEKADLEGIVKKIKSTKSPEEILIESKDKLKETKTDK